MDKKLDEKLERKIKKEVGKEEIIEKLESKKTSKKHYVDSLSSEESGKFDMSDEYHDERLKKELLKDIMDNVFREEEKIPYNSSIKKIEKIKATSIEPVVSEKYNSIEEDKKRLTDRLIKVIADYATNNPINYFTTEMPEYLKASSVIQYEDTKLNYQFLKMVNFFFSKVKKENYDRLVQEREAYQMVDGLINQEKFKELNYIMINGYELTKNQEYLLREKVSSIINSPSLTGKIENLMNIKKLPDIIKQSILLNDNYLSFKFSHNDTINKLEKSFAGYGNSKETRHILLQELIKSMNNLDLLVTKIKADDILTPLNKLYREHVVFFSEESYLEFAKYMVKFSEYVNNNNVLKERFKESGLKKLDVFLSLVISQRNLSNDLLVESLKPLVNKIEVLKSKDNSAEVVNLLDGKRFKNNKEFNEICDKILKGHEEIQLNKEYLNLELYVRLERLIAKHLNSMIDIYDSISTNKDVVNINGDNVEVETRDALNHILANVNEAISLINAEKADQLLIKSTQIKSLNIS